MKLIKSLGLVAAFSAAALASQAAVIGGVNQLVIGFQETGAANDVELNLGLLDTSNLLTVGTHNLGNVATLLNTNLGTDWTQISWAAAAATKLSAGGNEFVTSKWTSSTGTLGVANSDAFGSPSASAINNGITKVSQLDNGVVTGGLIAASDIKSFTVNSTTGFNFGPQAKNLLVNSGFSASDLYLLKANLDSSAPGVLGVSGFQGTLAVSSAGDITFTVIPEPSTYAVILGALTIGFVALRRRFSKAV
jgi:hypothetical protein